MTLYGEGDDDFRPKPRALALTLAGTSLLLISASVTILITALVDMVLGGRASLSSFWFVFAPFATDYRDATLYPAAVSLFSYAQPLLWVAGGSILLAGLVLFFWPTEQRLSTRLGLCHFALMLAVFGSGVIALRPQPLMIAPEGDPMPLLARLAVASLSLLLIVAAERQTGRLLANIYDLGTPSRRIRRWSERSAVGLLLIGASCAFGGYHEAAIATTVAFVVTFLTAVGSPPRGDFQKVAGVRLEEESILLPIAAVMVVGAQIVVFGFPSLGFESRAVVVRGAEVRVVPTGSVELPPAEKNATVDESENMENDGPVIDIRWSRPRAGEGRTAADEPEREGASEASEPDSSEPRSEGNR